MFSIVYALIARFKALFMTHAVLELEADLIAACAERKAELLRKAKQFEEEGLPSVAEQLRQRAESLSADKPLGSVLTTLAYLQADQAMLAKPEAICDQALRDPAPVAEVRFQPVQKKKSRKS